MYGRYWTVDPKGDKMEALAVPTALQEALVSHSASLALASGLFTLLGPLQVRLPICFGPIRRRAFSLLCVVCTAWLHDTVLAYPKQAVGQSITVESRKQLVAEPTDELTELVIT